MPVPECPQIVVDIEKDFNYSEKHDTHRHVSSLEHGRWLGVCCAVSPDGFEKNKSW